MNIPVLTYHAMNVSSNNYAENDHLALASDLETIAALGLRVIPLRRAVDWHQGLAGDDEVRSGVAITFDDGAWFDFYDLDHPSCGIQRGMINILRDFNACHASAQQAHATSFVIASPQARASLDERCMIGRGWWGDEWWAEAASSGLLDIGCHSWDHVHPELDNVSQQDQVKGDFSEVKSCGDCEVQFARAAEYIAGVLGGRRPDLFAYPYGRASDYAVKEYLPAHRERHGYRAAFGTEARAMSRQDDVWLLPRFVCGRDWRSPRGLRDMLAFA